MGYGSLDGEEVEYRGRIILLMQGLDTRWSATAWRDKRSLLQVPGGMQFADTREEALRLAMTSIDRDLEKTSAQIEVARRPKGKRGPGDGAE